MSAGLLFLSAVIAAAGMIVGRLVGISSPLLAMLVGLAGVAMLTMLLATTGTGCAGGECVGDIVALLVAGPIGIGGAGMALSGLYVLQRRRLLASHLGHWSGKMATAVYWSMPILALAVTGSRAVAEHAEQSRWIARMDAEMADYTRQHCAQSKMSNEDRKWCAENRWRAVRR